MTVRPIHEQICNWDDSIFLGPQSGVGQPPIEPATEDIFTDDDPNLLLSLLLMGTTPAGPGGPPPSGDKFAQVTKLELLQATANMFCIGSERLIAATGMNASMLGKLFLEGKYPEFFDNIARYAESLQASLAAEIAETGKAPTEGTLDLIFHINTFKEIVDRTPWLKEGLMEYLDVDDFYAQAIKSLNGNAAGLCNWAAANTNEIEAWLTALKNNADNPGKLSELLGQTDEKLEALTKMQDDLRAMESLMLNGFVDEKYRAEYRLKREIFHYLRNRIVASKSVKDGTSPVARLKDYGPPNIAVLKQLMVRGWVMTEDARAYLEGEAPKEIFPVLINMVENAKRARVADREFKGEISLDRRGGHITLIVKDNGSGIPQEVRGKLFAEFGPQVHGDKTTPGSGEGLYNASQIVKGMGGKICYETLTAEEAAASKAESFTTFYIELPEERKAEPWEAPITPQPRFREFQIGPDGLPVGRANPIFSSQMIFPEPPPEGLVDTLGKTVSEALSLGAEIENLWKTTQNGYDLDRLNPETVMTPQMLARQEAILDALGLALQSGGKTPPDITICVAGHGSRDVHTIALLLRKGYRVVSREDSVVQSVMMNAVKVMQVSQAYGVDLAAAEARGQLTLSPYDKGGHPEGAEYDMVIWTHPERISKGALVENLKDGGFFVIQTTDPMRYVDPFDNRAEWKTIHARDISKGDTLFPTYSDYIPSKGETEVVVPSVGIFQKGPQTALSQAAQMAMDEADAGGSDGGRESEAAKIMGSPKNIKPEDNSAREDRAKIVEEAKKGVEEGKARTEREKKK